MYCIPQLCKYNPNNHTHTKEKYIANCTILYSNIKHLNQYVSLLSIWEKLSSNVLYQTAASVKINSVE